MLSQSDRSSWCDRPIRALRWASLTFDWKISRVVSCNSLCRLFSSQWYTSVWDLVSGRVAVAAALTTSLSVEVQLKQSKGSRYRTWLLCVRWGGDLKGNRIVDSVLSAIVRSCLAQLRGGHRYMSATFWSISVTMFNVFDRVPENTAAESCICVYCVYGLYCLSCKVNWMPSLEIII